MIQRIQTIFLLLAAIIIGLLTGMPMCYVKIDGNLESMDASKTPFFKDGIFNAMDNQILFFSGIIIGILALITLFLYKNRKLQLILTKFNIFLIILYIGVIGYFFYTEYSFLNHEEFAIKMTPATFFPLLVLIFNILAVRYISKDERLVKSADRLR